MRDERWVNPFLFAWNNTLFYDPLDLYYQPRDDNFISTLDEHVRSRFVRGGLWWNYRQNPDLPAQGWKIHVSADQRNHYDIAKMVSGYLISHGIDFKIALDVNILEVLNSKGMARGGSGKFITIYPHDDDEFRACLADLARLLGDAEGAYVLSDMRYRDSKALYFRYGQLLDTHTIDAMGRKKPYVVGPDGPIPDERQPTFVHPWWLPWPFSDWKPDTGSDQIELLGGRFRVTEAIQFSSRGGVYLAEDTADGDRVVVLKEARPHTNLNPRRDHDAVDILAREWSFLNRLADTGCFPAPIAMFSEWEHHFIAQEYVDGSDIRAILFRHNPLVQPRVEVDKSREFLRIYLAVFRGLARAIQAAHERQVILGDLAAANLLIHPETFKVTVIDLESCGLAASAAADTTDPHLQGVVELYTPGFSHSRRVDGAPAMEGDLYSLAAIMSYLIFPVAAMSYLRDDVFDLFELYIGRLGWPAWIHGLLTGLAEAQISLAEVLQALDNEAELVAAVGVPASIVVADGWVAEAEAGVAGFITTVADADRATLFPTDPFAHLTNPLSLGFGAAGVLWALNASGIAVRPEWLEWLRRRVGDIDIAEYPAGLMSGLAGIAWAADGLGLRTEARVLLERANRRALDYHDYTFYYGLAGLGMTNLHFYLRDKDESDLAAAWRNAEALRDSAHHDGGKAFWLNEFSAEGPLTGLGFGQAGVALFLLRMSQITGDESYRRLGQSALDWEMANAVPWGDDSLSFNYSGTLVPYVEVGVAGVARVLLRYGDLDTARILVKGLSIDQTAMPGYAFGMCGIADTMLDAATILGEPSHRQTTLRQLDYVRRVFLFEPPQRFAVAGTEGVTPLALPGEGLLRCSCDLMTGSAGVLRVLHRVTAGGMADFLLDDVPGVGA